MILKPLTFSYLSDERVKVPAQDFGGSSHLKSVHLDARAGECMALETRILWVPGSNLTLDINVYASVLIYFLMIHLTTLEIDSLTEWTADH